MMKKISARAFCLALCCVAILALNACTSASGLRFAPPSRYDAAQQKPEELAMQADAYTAWVCVDSARETAILFQPAQSRWHIQFLGKGWRTMEGKELQDAIMVMRHNYDMSRFAGGIGNNTEQGKEFIAYIFSPLTIDARMIQNTNSLVVDTLLYSEIVRQGESRFDGGHEEWVRNR